MENNYRDLIGDILEASGEKDNYKGELKGKPLSQNYLQKDLFQNFQEKAKEAGFLPAWIRLQKKISSLIHEAKDEQDITSINEQIKKYNSICPPPMQKMTINLNELSKAQTKW